MKKFRVVDLEKLQHYKDRNPPWIKLYNDLLDDYNFSCLQDASKLHHILICLLASRSNNELPYDSRWISNRINATESVNLEELESRGFIEVTEDDSEVLADCKQSAIPETEGEGETDSRESKARVREKKKVSLQELSVDHIASWLAEKRSQSRYIHHDEHFVLEQFRGYCQANGKVYKDYVAGLRNAFEWEKCQPREERNGKTKHSTGESKRDKFNRGLAEGFGLDEFTDTGKQH